MRRALASLTAVLGLAAVVAVSAPLGADAAPRDPVRFATFNASLNRAAAGQLRAQLEAAVDGTVDPQLQAVLDIVEANDPDVLLINEFDTGVDGDPSTVALFAQLAKYEYWFTAPSNTGVPSGLDLDNSGSSVAATTRSGSAPSRASSAWRCSPSTRSMPRRRRTFQTFRWADMPGARLPIDPATGQSWYSPAELEAVRLSSKSHWDVPIDVDGRTVHFLVSHPTPPVFDGPEDRNGTRNFDEIRFWADYVRPGNTSRYIYDDAGGTGGLRPGERFVIAGDQNSDPLDGDSIPGSIQQLLEHPQINTRMTPASEGAVEASILQGGANTTHRSDPAFDTADFADTAPGNLRADYVLPSRDLKILASGVFWPRQHRSALGADRGVPVPLVGPPPGVGRRAQPRRLIAARQRRLRSRRWISGSKGGGPPSPPHRVGWGWRRRWRSPPRARRSPSAGGTRAGSTKRRRRSGTGASGWSATSPAPRAPARSSPPPPRRSVASTSWSPTPGDRRRATSPRPMSTPIPPRWTST